MPAPITMPSTPPTEVRNDGLEQELPEDLARRAPSAFRTPISRVRSVTEIIMIAITPMPPTIRAIDEMTTSARKVALVIWSKSFSAVSCVATSKSFGWSSSARAGCA